MTQASCCTELYLTDFFFQAFRYFAETQDDIGENAAVPDATQNEKSRLIDTPRSFSLHRTLIKP